MKTHSAAPMMIVKIGYIVMSVLLCAAGILLIVLPELSASVIGICIGIAMLVFGVIKLVSYFSKDLFRLAFQYDLEFGVLLIILGIIVLLNFRNVMNFICIALGVAILLDGLFKVRISIESRRFGVSGWWVILVLAILTAVIGIMLIFDSTTGWVLLSVLLGISLLAEGVLNLCTVITAARVTKDQTPDVIEIYDDTDKKEK